MRQGTRMPEIALPFAVVGAAGGWLSADFLTNPLVNLTAECNPWLTAASAAAVATSVGRSLTRRFGERASWSAPPSATWVQLVIAVSLGGTVTGAAVGGLTWLTSRGLLFGAGAGLLCAIPFLPVCGLVVAAARRAARARLGSIVAGSDRRAMWAIMMAALAVVTLLALPGWIALGNSFARAPHVARIMAAGAGVIAMALLIADGVARRRVARVGVAGMELREAGADADRDDPAPELDFGLGEEVLAKMARGGAAYRTRERAVALVLGSLEQARGAIRQAMVRGAIGLAIIGAALVCHALNLPRAALVAYHEYQCSPMLARSCRVAASLLEAAPEGEARRARAAAAFEQGCDYNDEPSCNGLARMRRRAAEEWSDGAALGVTTARR